MIQLRLERDTYAKHNDMIRWCLNNIGFSARQSSDVDEDRPFSHSQAFGYLTLTFHNEFDAFRFKLQWGGTQIVTTPTEKLVEKLMNSRIKKPYGGTLRGNGLERVYPFDDELTGYLVNVLDKLDALGYTIEKKKDDNTND